VITQPNGPAPGHSASNPTSRVLDVLNFLAAHPTEAFTLAELSRHLDQSKASAHRILKTMAEAGYLSRHAQHRTFMLGVVPVAIGQAALERHRGVDAARRQMVHVAEELGVLCCAATVVDDERLLLAKEGKPQSHEGLQRIGERMPFVPPIGMAFMAWSSESEIDHYLAKISSHVDSAMEAHMRDAFPVIRERGYSVFGSGPAMQKMRQTAILPAGWPRDNAFWSSFHQLIGELSADEVQLFDLGKANQCGIGYMTAPVFAPDGSVAIELEINGMPTGLGADEIETYGRRLRLAADFVTDEIHGLRPRF